MKKSLIAMMMLLTLATTAEASGQKHRHHQSVTVTTNSSTNDKTVVEDTMGLVAYSDTTSVDTAGTTPITVQHSNWDEDFEDDPFSALNNLVNVGVGILCLLIILLAPLIAIIAIIWLLVRNRNQRLKLAEKAMETGQPIPQEALRAPAETDGDLWTKGIRNLFLGLGLIACGYFFIGDLLQGIGVVMAFYGAGQAIISRTSKKKDDSDITASDSPEV